MVVHAQLFEASLTSTLPSSPGDTMCLIHIDPWQAYAYYLSV